MSSVDGRVVRQTALFLKMPVQRTSEFHPESIISVMLAFLQVMPCWFLTEVFDIICVSGVQ